MPDILQLFDQRTVIDYVNARQYKPLLGESLFPARKVESLEFDILKAGRKIPVAASIHAFDTEAEIGSRQASKGAQELGFIKRKMQIKEKDLIALRNPRTPQEQAYLEKEVYNDVDSLVEGVNARMEAMRMDVLANGRVTVKENGLNYIVDYHVPAEHKKILTGSDLWTNSGADPIGMIQDWVSELDVAPTRALTSSRVISALLKHPAILELFKRANILPTRGNLNSILDAFELPKLASYDAKYLTQQADGTYKEHRYFPENKIAFFGDELLGESVFGPTPEESRFLTGDSKDTKVGNVFATVYESSKDPVSTWIKACATGMPSFPAADDVIQAEVLPPTV